MSDQDFGEVAFKAYANAIKAKAGNVGRDPNMDQDYWFTAGDTNRSIPASRYIPTATTNEFLFQEANVLLKPTQPVYTPGSGTTGYVEALLQYLLSVQPAKGEETPEQKLKRKELQKELDEADENYTTRRRKALKDWREEKKDDPDTPDFRTWCRSNAKVFLSAEDAYSIASGRLGAFLLELYGGDYADWDNERARLQDAKLAKEFSAGVTMPCKVEPVLGLAEAIKKAKKDGHGAPVPEPEKSDLYYRAAYNIDPTYRDSMDRWALDFDVEGTSGSIKLDFETAKKTKWSEFGFKNVDAGGGISFFGLFRIGGRGGSRHEYKEIKVNESKSSVAIELSWKQLQFFNVSPGIWNIPQIRKKYKNTTNRSPELETLIRPVQFLCASKLTLTCTVSGEVTEQLDKAIKDQSSVSGGGNVIFNLFGFYASGGTAKEDNIETSTFTWNKSKGELKVIPAPTFGNSVLLGVRGQQVSV
ncbi:hypothetical protein Neosp_015273 [[Neocosmospora] mangrovei]